MTGDVQKPTPPSLTGYALRLLLKDWKISGYVYDPFKNEVEFLLNNGSKATVKLPFCGSVAVTAFASESVREVIGWMTDQVKEMETRS
jgi:hypothetical protein